MCDKRSREMDRSGAGTRAVEDSASPLCERVEVVAGELRIREAMAMKRGDDLLTLNRPVTQSSKVQMGASTRCGTESSKA
jgi:hypothetical protein